MRKQWQFQLIGWILFVICAVLYSVSSFLAGDLIGLIGGGFFLAGCISFMIPLLRERDK